MDERRLVSTTRHSSSEIARLSFSTVRKGFDPNEVKSYFDSVAREMSLLESRIRDLQEQLAEALRRAANPVIDEATLAGALGSQSAAILRSAHDEAGRVTAEAQERTAQLFSESQQRAAAHLMEAQERATVVVNEAEAAAAIIDSQARQGADRLIETAKTNGQMLVERGREHGRAIVDQASEARRTILNDLAVKRKALHIQIDQLRAARDTLGASVTSLREQVDHVLSTITTSDDAARQAAIDALRLRVPMKEPTEEELLAGTPLRPVAEVALAAEPDVVVRDASPLVNSPTAPDSESFVDDDETGTDVVNEIFARLRKATLEERGASETLTKKVPAPPQLATPVGELFARRDQALEESLAVLTRKVKRALQDDQNIALERLRDVRGDPSAALEDELAQRARYADAALAALADAAAAGVQFAVEESGVELVNIERSLVEECTTDLAVTIVVALRRRIIADGHEDATERANAAYKEWRGARVERLCTDAARRAFHSGVLSASRGRSVQFLAAPNDSPCDACSLDAATIGREAGTAFPSGAVYPPVHAGCACTVIPT